MDKESYICSKFMSEKNGDDGAVVGKWVFSKDLFVEEVHFKRGWLSLKEIAIKSMLVNISDAIAMNAKPKYALLGLGLPKNISQSEIDEISAGFLSVANEYKIQIIGGDTISSDKLTISLTIISKTKNPLFRNRAKSSELVAYTGNLGSVVKDLERLEAGEKIDEKSKFITPKLRAKFLYKASKFITSAMDISDGLSKDLSRFLDANSLGIKFLKEPSDDEFRSGEEYEILFSFKPENLEKILKISKKTATKITIFGKLARLNQKTKFKNHIKEHHFI